MLLRLFCPIEAECVFAIAVSCAAHPICKVNPLIPVDLMDFKLHLMEQIA